MSEDAPSRELPGRVPGVPAVVLKLDRNVMHHGGLGAIRTLGRLGVEVYGVHESPMAPAASSRYLHGRCFWRPASRDPELIVTGLNRLAEFIGRRAVLIPTDDAGAIFLAEHGDLLADSFLFSRPAAGLPRRLAGKHSAYELFGELGVACPRSVVPGSLAEAQAFAEQVGYPVIAKLMTPWRVPAAALRSTSILAGKSELADCYQTCARLDAGLMLQELIPASPGCDWFMHGYCDASSACQPAFTGIKERSYPAYAGLTSFGRSAANAGLRQEMTDLTGKLGYQGILDLDLRWDHRDDSYKLLDFNPRLGAQFMLLRDEQGFDVVQAAYLDLIGRPIPASRQVCGRGFLVENYDFLGALRYWRDGEIQLRSWLSSLRGVSETAWFATDDLRPFGLMCVRMGWRMISRPFSRSAQGKRPQARHDLPTVRPGRAAARGSGQARRLAAAAPAMPIQESHREAQLGRRG